MADSAFSALFSYIMLGRYVGPLRHGQGGHKFLPDVACGTVAAEKQPISGRRQGRANDLPFPGKWQHDNR